MEYASKSVGTAGLTTGIIGTALGAVNSGILPILGGNCRNAAGCNSGDFGYCDSGSIYTCRNVSE